MVNARNYDLYSDMHTLLIQENALYTKLSVQGFELATKDKMNSDLTNLSQAFNKPKWSSETWAVKFVEWSLYAPSLMLARPRLINLCEEG